MDKIIHIAGEIKGDVTFNVYMSSSEKPNEEKLENNSSPEVKGRKVKDGKSEETHDDHVTETSPANLGAGISFPGSRRKDEDYETKQLKALYEHHRKNPDYFQMTIRPKGVVLIINNNDFEPTRLESRTGSDKDCESLWKAFSYIGVSRKYIKEKYDRSARDIMLKVQRLARSEKQASFYAIFIMSHGTNNENGKSEITGSDGVRVSAKEIVDQFNVPHLKETPILIFFQACRGSFDDDAGFESPKRYDADYDGERFARDELYDDDLERDVLDHLIEALPGGKIIGEVPDYATDAAAGTGAQGGPSAEIVADEDEKELVEGQPNVMVSYGTADGYTSLRDQQRGTLFIQEICKQLCSPVAKTKDLISLMDSIHISLHERRFHGQMRRYRAAARTAHTFGTKKLFLFPGL